MTPTPKRNDAVAESAARRSVVTSGAQGAPELRALVAKWRKRAKQCGQEGWGIGMESCANELEAALTQAQGTQPGLPCFTCEGEQGLPATKAVYICVACAGEEDATSLPTTPVQAGASSRETLEKVASHIIRGLVTPWNRKRDEVIAEIVTEIERERERTASPPAGAEAIPDAKAAGERWLDRYMRDLEVIEADNLASLYMEGFSAGLRTASPPAGARPQVTHEMLTEAMKELGTVAGGGYWPVVKRLNELLRAGPAASDGVAETYRSAAYKWQEKWREACEERDEARARLAGPAASDGAGLREALIGHRYERYSLRSGCACCTWGTTLCSDAEGWKQWIEHIAAARAALPSGEGKK
jgi:hypothetical protein